MSSEDSDSQSEYKPESDVLLPSVLEYCKKYSQSRRLPAYFRGNTLKVTEECQTELNVPVSIQVENFDDNQRVESPSSSIASNRRLEWDNGADIGYENAEQKDVSLPETTKDTSNREKCSGKPKSSSESGSDLEKTAVGAVAICESLKKKIGDPMAESTPIIYTETPVLKRKEIADLKRPRVSSSSGDSNAKKRSTSYEELSSSKSEHTVKRWNSEKDLTAADVVETKSMPLRKVINLRPTKPTVVECLSSKSKKDKDVQTSLVRNSSAAVQTDNLEREVTRGSLASQNRQTSVVYAQHSDLEKSENRNSSCTQTDSEAYVSKCNSFEFLYGEAFDRKPEEPEGETAALKRSQARTNLLKSEEESTGSSRSSFKLGEVLAKKFSKDLKGEIDSAIALVQKLAKSKRYDEVTKRYYLRKIVEKIVATCYSDDSGDGPEPRHPNAEEYLQNNVPWQPVEKTKTPPKERLTLQTFTDEFVPEKPSSHHPKLRKSPFTLCHDHRALSSSGDAPSTLHTFSSTNSSDWREQKTVSERLLEEQKTSSTDDNRSGDHLLSFAKKERQHQLSWISNEIAHLNKLKELLESKKESSEVVRSLLKPHGDELVKGKKTTTVYMITTERSDGCSSRGSDRTDRQKRCTCKLHDYLSSAAGIHERGASKRPQKICDYCAKNIRKLSTSDQDAPVDLQNARLVSNEVFTTASADGKSAASVCRYTFEIPFAENLSLNTIKNIGVSGKRCSCSAHAGSQATSRRRNEAACACAKSSDAVVQSAEPSKECPGMSSEKQKTGTSVAQTSNLAEGKCCQTCGCPLPSAAGTKARPACKCAESNTDLDKSSSETQTLKPQMKEKRCQTCGCPLPSEKGTSTDVKSSCKCSEASASRERVSSEVQTAKPPTKKKLCQTCGCALSSEKGTETDMEPSCKCVEADMPSEKSSTQSQTVRPPTKKKHCQTCGCPLPSEKGTETDAEPVCKCVQADAGPESATSGSQTSGRSTKTKLCQTCGCPLPSENADSEAWCKCDRTSVRSSSGRSRSASAERPSSAASSSSDFTLCPCCRLNKVAVPSERSLLDSRPSSGHLLCYPCYTQCERTVAPGSRPYYTYPGHTCNCYTVLKTSTVDQIRRTVRELDRLEEREDGLKGKKNGVAYLLTLESGEATPEKPRKGRCLPEVKVKVADRKCWKERENCQRKREKNHEQAGRLTLQQYLCVNKPDFVQSAEERRRCLLELAFLREQRCQNYKRLLALTGGVPLEIRSDERCNEKRMFTTKEMKAITEKNYKKLPEVRQKLVESREKQIKLANRLLADMFNKKIRECALKGETNLSTSYSVINFA